MRRRITLSGILGPLPLLMSLSRLVGATETVDRPTVDVYILAGQSNAIGIAHQSELTRYGEHDVFNMPMDSYGTNDSSILYSYRHIHYTDGNIQDDQKLGELRSQSNGYFGPEQSLARDLSRSSQHPIALLKFASGGSALSQWHPNNHTLYPEFLQFLSEERELLEQKGFNLNWSGLFWVQGESEANSEERSRHYNVPLDQFVSQLRTDLQKPDLPVVMASLKTNLVHYAGYPYEDLNVNLRIINQVVHTYDVSHEQFALTRSNDDLSLRDGIHYRADSVIELGHRLYSTYRTEFQSEEIGDLNLDGRVDTVDFSIATSQFTGGSFDGVRSADFTLDGYVDGADMAWLFQCWSGNEVEVVPEPSSSPIGPTMMLFVSASHWLRSRLRKTS